MRKRFGRMLLVPVLAAAVVGALLKFTPDAGAMVGGTHPLDTIYGEIPVDDHGDWIHEGKWAVRIKVPGTCSGAVVRPHWVITARHCVDKHFPQGMDFAAAPDEVKLDTPYEDQDTVVHPVKMMFRHMDADLALLYLEDPYEVKFNDGSFGTPLAPEFATAQPPEGWGSIGYGFGHTEGDDEGPLSTLVKAGGMERNGDQGTDKFGGAFDWYDAKQVTCLYRNGKLVYPPGRSNGGDSGGPVLSHKEGGGHQLAGLLIGHSGDNLGDDSKVETLHDKLDWIEERISMDVLPYPYG